MLYILNLYSAVYSLYCKKTGEKRITEIKLREKKTKNFTSYGFGDSDLGLKTVIRFFPPSCFYSYLKQNKTNQKTKILRSHSTMINMKHAQPH